ncbi:MAG: binding domain protein excisionase family [Ilumatobacteraceae bacterium]|nr:binding domain protein excisionase family [Ilumatobacteraceae bacterium]
MTMMTADDAAARLGIKLESLYAYVSRGLVERHHAADGRSMFEAQSIEALATRGRPRLSSRQTSLHLLIETQLTLVDSHRISYRGHQATELGRTHTFEQVADLLWLGELAAGAGPWRGTAVARPAGVGAADSLRITTACAAAADPMRADLERGAVAAAGRHLIASMVDSLADQRPGRVPQLTLRDGRRVRGTIAGRLWTALAPQRPRAGMVETLNAILVLLADHELAASTLAARVAASARADPYSVVGAGLGTVNGVLHGQASSYARRVLDDAADIGAGPALTIAQRTWPRVPGFGQPLYPEGDPRAVMVLGMLRDALGDDRSLAVADAVITAVRQRSDVHPNVDFALGVFTQAARMPSDAGETIFSVARTAGWLAHAIEEYGEQPLRFRPRAAYTGVR